MALKLSSLRDSPFFFDIPAFAAPWKGAHLRQMEGITTIGMPPSMRQPIKISSRVLLFCAPADKKDIASSRDTKT